jgi:hypothetical protein
MLWLLGQIPAFAYDVSLGLVEMPATTYNGCVRIAHDGGFPLCLIYDSTVVHIARNEMHPATGNCDLFGRFAEFLAAESGVLKVPGRVQSRINIKNDGIQHVIDRHLSGAHNASQFNMTEAELRSLLNSKKVVQTPVTRTLKSGEEIRYVREVDTGRIIGVDKFSGPTTIMTVLTDEFGNLVTATPGLIK